MASRTEIANLALGHLGQYRVTDLDENSPVAEAVRDAWDVTRDSVLRAHHWNFATGEATLTRLAAENVVGYVNQFALPADCLRLLSCNDVAAGTGETDFDVRQGVVCSDATTAKIEYVRRVKETELWDAAFVRLFAAELATVIAPRITLGSAGSAVENARQEAIQFAMLSDATETRPRVIQASTGSQYLLARRGQHPEIG